MDVIEAMKERGSIRAFLDKPVEKEKIQTILDAARWAPSGVNTQPWMLAVLEGKSKQALSDAYLKAFRSGEKANPDYHYYPDEWFEPFKSRRFACGMALYGALDIKRDDKERRNEVWELNYKFFNAPVALMFYIDKRVDKGSWMDMGMFLQNVMLAARGVGLETCPQAAMAEYPNIVREQLNISDDYYIVCGMALGYADMSEAINQYRTEREPLESFVKHFC